MWSVWMFTVPSLRARDCGAKEKDALNVLFIAIPLINVLIPFVWKSFAGVFTADVLLMLGVYYSKNAPPFGEEELTVASRANKNEREREREFRRAGGRRRTTTTVLFLK